MSRHLPQSKIGYKVLEEKLIAKFLYSLALQSQFQVIGRGFTAKKDHTTIPWKFFGFYYNKIHAHCKADEFNDLGVKV